MGLRYGIRWYRLVWYGMMCFCRDLGGLGYSNTIVASDRHILI